MRGKNLKPAALFAAACAALWLAAECSAQDEAGQTERSAKEDLEQVARKSPSLFNRPAKSTPAEQAEYADALLAGGRIKAAARQYSALVRKWHESPQAPYAQWQLSLLLDRMGRDKDAFREFQYLIRWFPGRFPFDQAIERQFQIANRIRTAKRARFMFGGFEAPEEALPFLEQVAKNAPRSRYAQEAMFQIALIREDAGDFEEATRAFEHVRITYPNGPYAEQAAFHRARCIAALSRLHPRNEPTYREAIAAFAQFLRDFPDSRLAEEAEQTMAAMKEKLAAMAYERAVFYDRRGGNPRAAIIALSDFVRNFPSSEPALRASRRLEELKKSMEAHKE